MAATGAAQVVPVPVGPDFDARDLMDGATLLASTANVIMQLAQPPVGYGVQESTVESGQVMGEPGRAMRVGRVMIR